MLRYVDRALAVVLGLGAAVGHTLGSVSSYAQQPLVLLWALNASVLGALLGAPHILRSFRTGDRALAWILAVGTICWIISSARFGVLIGRPFDPRVVVFIAVSLGLVAFSLRSAQAPSRDA